MNNKKPCADLMLITNSRLFSDKKSFLLGCEAALSAGVEVIQLREKTKSAKELLCLARDLREMTLEFKAALIINDRVDIAKLIGADGVHLPSDAFSPLEARAILGGKAVIGVSAHCVEEAQEAEAHGADYVTLSPIYYTTSKARYGSPIGLAPLRAATARLKIPIYALGGINKDRIKEVLGAGAAGAAVISAILASKDIRESARELREELMGYKERNIEVF